jgi:hypothetical protein
MQCAWISCLSELQIAGGPGYDDIAFECRWLASRSLRNLGMPPVGERERARPGWQKAARALKKDDQVYGQRLAEMAKKHSSEVFYGLDDPLEGGGILGAGGDAEGPICGRQEGQD